VGLTIDARPVELLVAATPDPVVSVGKVSTNAREGAILRCIASVRPDQSSQLRGHSLTFVSYSHGDTWDLASRIQNRSVEPTPRSFIRSSTDLRGLRAPSPTPLRSSPFAQADEELGSSRWNDRQYHPPPSLAGLGPAPFPPPPNRHQHCGSNPRTSEGSWDRGRLSGRTRGSRRCGTC
jgi:hypothetical protein